MTDQHADTVRSDLDFAYWAWTVIANVSQGHWDEQTEEWREAATRWRDAFHAALDEDYRTGASWDAHIDGSEDA